MHASTLAGSFDNDPRSRYNVGNLKKSAPAGPDAMDIELNEDEQLSAASSSTGKSSSRSSIDVSMIDPNLEDNMMSGVEDGPANAEDILSKQIAYGLISRLREEIQAHLKEIKEDEIDMVSYPELPGVMASETSSVLMASA